MKIGASFSIGRVSYMHDVRLSNTANVDLSLSNDNIVLVDKLAGKSIEEYTNERMKKVIEEYNEKQTRKDRRIDTDYVSYFNSNRNHGQLAYEAVLQYGEHDTLGGEYYSADCSADRKKQLYDEYKNMYRKMLLDMRKNYPHLEVLYATIHFDEPQGTPHMHVCFQPIGTNYKKGLPQQVSIGNALACDGIERLKKRTDALEGGFQLQRFFTEFRHKYMNEPLMKRGYELKEEQHGIPHMEVEPFKRAKKKLKEIEDEISVKEEELAKISQSELLELHKQLLEFDEMLRRKQEKLEKKELDLKGQYSSAKTIVSKAVKKAVNEVTEENLDKYQELRKLAIERNPELVEAFDKGLRARINRGEAIGGEILEEYASIIGLTM